MDIEAIKRKVDQVANIVKMIEEIDPTAKILPNLGRSLQLDRHSCGADEAALLLLPFFLLALHFACQPHVHACMSGCLQSVHSCHA